MNDQHADKLLQLLERIALALETLARAGAPAEPNYIKPLGDYREFDWESIGASVVQADADGPTHLEWGGALWTRRSPSNKFSPAIWYSRASGKDEEGNNKYLRLITFRPVGDAEPVPDKVAAAAKDSRPAAEPVQPGGNPPMQRKPTGPLSPEKGSPVQRPYPPEALKNRLIERAKTYASLKCSPEQRGLAAMMIEKCFAGEGAQEKRRTVQLDLFGVASLRDVHDSIILVLLNDWLRPQRDSGGDYQADPLAVKEAQLVYRAALLAEGQKELAI